MRPFESVTVILLATNETDSLKKIIYEILENCSDEDLGKIIVYLISDDCPSAVAVREMVEEGVSNKIEWCVQSSRNTQKAFANIPTLVETSHFVIMASDGEMDPATLKDFIAIAKQKPYSIVCGAKWSNESVVEGHALHRKLGSRFIDTFTAAVFGVEATDLFSIFQIYPTQLYKDMNFKKPARFMYEYTLKPLRFGVEYIEIPTVYRKEKGRKNNWSMLRLSVLAVNYCFNVLRIRFTPKKFL